MDNYTATEIAYKNGYDKGYEEATNRLQADKEKLEYILMGVMHSVDKWLEGEELNHDETNRAIIMREKTLQIVEKQQAEIRRYKNCYEQVKWERDLFEEQCKTAKAEAIKEFAEDVCGEIDDAIHSNYNAKEEREAKCKKLGIPIDAEDSYLMYCEGKIHALSGIRNYIFNLVKEMVGDNE